MSEDSEKLQIVCQHLGYTFRDLSILRDALTHRSFVNEKPKLAPRDNERLEFLGDSILGWAAAQLLYERFPKADEGELSRRRADLVCTEALAQAAQNIEIGPALRLGKGESLSGGREKPRLLAGAYEATIAAVCLDSDIPTTLQLARRLLERNLEKEAPGAKDYKSRLQQILQARHGKPPEYILVKTEGPGHRLIFHVELRANDQVLGHGSGPSKLRAEQHAAERALSELET